MRPEYRDWIAERDKRKKAKARDFIPSLEILQQASVKAEYLTSYDEWNTFLSYVQSAIEKAKTHLATLDGMLTSPQIVNHDTLMQIKIERESVASMIRAWDAAVTLPVQIIEKGEEAQNRLVELVGSDEDERAA